MTEQIGYYPKLISIRTSKIRAEKGSKKMKHAIKLAIAVMVAGLLVMPFGVTAKPAAAKGSKGSKGAKATKETKATDSKPASDAKSSDPAGPKTAPAPQDNALPLDQVIQKVQANYQKVNTYMVDFDQELFSPSRDQVVSKGSGFVIYQKPGKMVWRYGKPEEQYYFIDGNTVCQYIPADKEAIILPLKDRTIRSFLLGLGDLKKDFEVSFHEGRALTPSGRYQLALVPKDASDREAFGTIIIYLDPNQNYMVEFTKMTDGFGNENRMHFINMKINTPIDPSKFKFTPPPDVKVTQAKDLTGGGKK
jgi:outer membrane lipoprotein carrier protein